MSGNKQQKIQLQYSRKNDTVEIKGDPVDVKQLAWFDMLTNRIIWIIAVFLFLFYLPQVSFLPLLLRWLKSKIVMIVLGALVDYLLTLSG